MFAALRGRHSPTRPDTRARLSEGFDTLEDRTAPAVHSSIVSNFNGTAIPAGDSLWFNSVTKVSGLPAGQAATVHVANQSVTFLVDGVPTTVPVPDTTITFNPATPASAATTTYTGAWTTSAPAQVSGNVFLSGVSFQVPASGIAGGSAKTITWQGDFWSNTPGLKLNWQWSAAVYTNLSSDPAALGVKPTDTATAQYANSDHAGTPENYKTFVIGGARGGGGSNFTGSYSATGSLGLDQVPPVTQAAVVATLSGNVHDQFGNGLSGLTVTLTGTDANNAPVFATTTTDGSGNYSFGNLLAGTYTITLTYDTMAYSAANALVGSLGGQGSNGTIAGIAVNGVDGTSYDFVLIQGG
jgi:hypothetical protein